MPAVRDTIKRLIRLACGITGEVPGDARLGEIPGWDSLSHIALMLLLEETFGRRPGPSEVHRLTSVPAIEAWLRRGTSEAEAMAPPTVDDVARALHEAGLRRGDLAMVHSFTAVLGPIERPDRLMIDALLEVLGPEGTLVLPAFTYSFCRTGVFEPEASRSEVGVAADTLREEYGGVRSLHPIFSACAVGPLADEIAALRGETTFGEGSIFQYMRSRRGKVCVVGVGYEKVTLSHAAEEEVEVPYRYWKRFDGVIRRNGCEEPVSVEYFVRSLAPEAKPDFSIVHELMREQSFSGRAQAGAAEIWCAPAEEYHQTLRHALAEDPLLLLTPASRVHWQEPTATEATIAGLQARLGQSPCDMEVARELAAVLAARGDTREAHEALMSTAVAAGDFASLAAACRAARDLLPVEEAAADTATISVGWIGAHTLDPLAEAAETHIRAAGIIAATTVGRFGQFRHDLAVEPMDVDLVFVRVPPEALDPALQAWRYAGGDPVAARQAGQQLAGLVRSWLDRRSGHAIVHLLPAYHRSALGIADPQSPDGASAVIRAFNEPLIQFAREHSRAHLLDETAALLRAGAPAYDADMRYHAGFDLSGPAISAIAQEASRFAIAARRRPVKCIVCDLDNTLWGGVVGEDGPRGLSLAGEYPGEAHLELQRWLLAQHAAGVLLAICSRNEAADGMAPFEERPEMLLAPEHFAAISIDWRPKHERIPEIARDLNIGVDSLVFLDDSPFERASVREALPEVIVPELPPEVSHWVDYLAALHLTDALALTDEDRRRAEMYVEDRERQDHAQAAADFDAFLAGLGSVAMLYFDEPALLARTTQLCARTNQFNLTSRRHSEGEIERMIADESTRVIQMRASDRFGDMGVVGIAIVRAQGATAELDTFLLSCRALGRGYERALLSETVRVATEELGTRAVIAAWSDNGRNSQVAEFLDSIGCARAERDGATVFTCEGPVAWPEHIERRIG